VDYLFNLKKKMSAPFTVKMNECCCIRICGSPDQKRTIRPLCTPLPVPAALYQTMQPSVTLSKRDLTVYSIQKTLSCDC